ncbi:MAG TPA: PAS domain-containing protein [Polyangiaceae bacterium]|nr:PAS domain-containing protein [Polyangiaceae bacterium]
MSGDPSDAELARLRLRVAELEAALAREPRHASGEGSLLPETLTAREAKLSEVERAAHLGTWVWDTRSQAVSWSDGLYRILGYDPKRVAPSVDAFYAAVHPEDRARVQETSQRNAETGDTGTLACRIRWETGEIREVVLDGTAIRSPEGRLLGFAGTVLDVTERNAKERALARSEALLGEAQTLAHVGSWVWDLSTGATEWSKELYRIVGLPTDARASRRLWLERVHPDDLARFKLAIDQVVGGADLSSVDVRVVRPDGEIRWIQGTARALHDAEGRRVGYTGIVHDLTERRRLEDQLRQSQKMEAIGRVAAGIAHDFNNVLTVIRGNADILLMENPNEELRQIAEAASRATELTRLLLTLGRKAPLDPREIDLAEEIERSLRIVRRLVSKEVSIEVDVKRPLWSVVADPTQVHQVVSNLVLNANDSMPAGGSLVLRLENVVLDPAYAREHPDARPGEHVLLEVRDTGTGMTEHVRAHALEPFFTTKESGKGTGLGLPTVFGIVRQGGGSLDIESAPGRGTSVRVFLPRAVP